MKYCSHKGCTKWAHKGGTCIRHGVKIITCILLICTHSAMATMVAALVSASPEFHIAPMQCYTNQPLRKLTGFLSPSSVKWTEMEKVDDLLPNVESALEKRLGGEEEDANLILQLGSNDVDKLDTCVRVATQKFPNLREINLNCGCPAIDTGGASTYGASLMKDASLTARLVESMSAASNNDVDISVKCRIGVFDDDIPHQLNENDYQYLTNYISAIHDAGAKHVILHARPAILSLSPVKNRIIPNLDYAFVNRIASDFEGKVKITLNGGIKCLSHLRALQSDGTNISSYMSGRWCLRRPLDLVAIEQLHENDVITDTRAAIDSYIDYASANQSLSQFTMADLCLPLFLVVEQLREEYEQDEEGELLSWEDMESIYDAIQDGLQQLGGGRMKTSNSINFKRLASAFKPLVGTKIVNKWKRNRSEL